MVGTAAARVNDPTIHAQTLLPLNDASILSFAIDRWDDVPRCRHHVMSRLSRRNRVLFVSKPPYVRDLFRRDRWQRGGLRRISDTLHTWNPPRWLPYMYRFSALDQLSFDTRMRVIRRLMGRLRMERPILYVWHPWFADVIGQFDECVVVYHCYDEHAGFAGADRARIVDREARVLEAANLVFAVSDGLYRLKRAINPNTHLVRNGVDYDLFAAAQHPATPLAAELRGIGGPVVGCVTRIVPQYFDAALLHEIFSRRRDWSFVVVGPEYAGDASTSRALSRLKELPNVHMLGRRSLEDLPSYLKGFDACLIPYVLTENKLLADPLKLYEYLAAGKPVVSKPLPLEASFHAAVSFAGDNADEWINAIDEAVRSDSPDRIAMRQELASRNTWDQRVGLIEHLIASKVAA